LDSAICSNPNRRRSIRVSWAGASRAAKVAEPKACPEGLTQPSTRRDKKSVISFLPDRVHSQLLSSIKRGTELAGIGERLLGRITSQYTCARPLSAGTHFDTSLGALVDRPRRWCPRQDVRPPFGRRVFEPGNASRVVALRQQGAAGPRPGGLHRACLFDLGDPDQGNEINQPVAPLWETFVDRVWVGAQGVPNNHLRTGSM